MDKKKSLSCVAPVVAAIAIAGCGGGERTHSTSAAAGGGNAYGQGGNGAAPAAATSASGHSSANTTITVRHDKLGAYLADARGRALYLFEADTGGASSCYSACASVWPPLTGATTGTPSRGVTRTLLGTTKRKDGSAEVTYDGHPLYLYAGDAAAGAINGQGLNQFGAKWYLVAPNGKKIDTDGH
jgi:predicted lipoprotein with Yx(FWY)xxD motif